MIRKIVQIDEEKCTGCGLCAAACHEGAIVMEDGKAKLIRDDYCDGLGDCLPECPADAIAIVAREAVAYDEDAVEAHLHATGQTEKAAKIVARREAAEAAQAPVQSQLTQWPVQMKLVPAHAPWLNGADLLIAADCTAFAYGDFHNTFVKGHKVVVGCPKLDGTNYADKLEMMIRSNDIKSLTVVRMEVPCCGGIVFMAEQALAASGKKMPIREVIISTTGEILDDQIVG